MSTFRQSKDWICGVKPCKVLQKLVNNTNKGLGDWIDLAGLIAPKNEVYTMLDEIENNELNLKQILEKCWEFHNEYYNYEWTWAQQKLEEYWQKPINEVNKEEIIDFIERWKSSVVKLDQLLYEDAKKEFDLTSMTGFGVDGDDEQKKKDFVNVRGSFEKNPFVREVLNHIEKKTALGKSTIEFVEKLS